MTCGYFKLNPDASISQKKMVALISAGAQSGSIFFDVTGRSAELFKLIELLNFGDVLVVDTAADVATSPAELAAMIDRLGQRGVSFVAVEEPWLSCSPQSERNILSTRGSYLNADFQHGLEQKKSVGRPKGPQRDIVPKLNFALNLYHTAGHLSIRQICSMAKLNERTFYRHLERQGYQVVRRLKGRKSTKINY